MWGTGLLPDDQPCALCNSAAEGGLPGQAIFPCSRKVFPSLQYSQRQIGTLVAGAISFVSALRGAFVGGIKVCGVEPLPGWNGPIGV